MDPNRKCLLIREAGLGEEHPLVGDTLVEVAQNLRSARKFPAAEEMLRRALSIREKCMGPTHPKTGDCVLKLTLLLKVKGLACLQSTKFLMNKMCPSIALSCNSGGEYLFVTI